MTETRVKGCTKKHILKKVLFLPSGPFEKLNWSWYVYCNTLDQRSHLYMASMKHRCLMPANQTWLSGLLADGLQITATDSSPCCLSTSKNYWSLQGLRSWNKLHQRVFLNSQGIYQSKPASLTVQTITPCHRELEANRAALYSSGPLTSFYLANIFVFLSLDGWF